MASTETRPATTAKGRIALVLEGLPTYVWDRPGETRRNGSEAMGDRTFEIILFALVAAYLCYRLWSVLGHRNPVDRQQPSAFTPPPQPGNAVPLGSRVGAPPPRPPEPGVDPLGAGIAAIRAADPNFRPENFLAGAAHAFEIIVMAFAEGDTAKLRPLLGDEVYDTFAEAVRQRLAHREAVEARVLRLDPPSIVDAHLDGRTAIVTVKFVSSQTSVTRDSNGLIVEGDPDHAIERTDVWSFARNTRSSDPNWMLVGTGAPE